MIGDCTKSNNTKTAMELVSLEFSIALIALHASSNHIINSNPEQRFSGDHVRRTHLVTNSGLLQRIVHESENRSGDPCDLACCEHSGRNMPWRMDQIEPIRVIAMVDRWTQDDLDAMLEIVDALADVVNRMAWDDPRDIRQSAKSIHERARTLYQRKGG